MEKQHNKIDDQFRDQAWTRMSDLLDQEMPVEQKKRRFIWLWIPIGLSLLGILSYAYVEYVKHDSYNDEQESIATESIAISEDNLNIKSNENLVLKDSKELSDQQKSDFEPKQKKTIVNSVQENNITRKQTKPSFIPTRKSNSKEASQAQSIIKKEEVPIKNQLAKVIMPIVEKEANNSHINPILQNDASIEQASQYVSTPYLALLPITTSLNYDADWQLASPIAQTKQIILNNKNDFTSRLTFLTGVHGFLTGNNRFRGYGVHLGADYQFRPKLSFRLTTGIERFISRQGNDDDLSLAENESTNEPEQDLDAFDIDINQLSAIDGNAYFIQSTLGYELKHHVFVYGGIQYRHMLGNIAEAASRQFSTNNTSIGELFLESERNTPSNGQILIERNFFNPVAGLRIHYNQFELDLNYEYAIKSNFRRFGDDAESDKRSLIQLALNLKF